MKSARRKAAIVALIAAASCLSAGAAAAQSGTAAVNTQMRTYLAGGNVYTVSPGVGGGINPFFIALDPGVNRILTFSAVTGTATFCPGATCLSASPDGPSIGNTNLTASGSISGILSNSSGFLAGVFLGSALPGSAPASIDYGNNDFSSLSPLLGQQFFIGDGRTSSNVVQQFFMPDAATRLYLGIADGGSFIGNPGFYDDNVGTYSATYSISGRTTTVPEPSTLLLSVAGFAAIGFVRRRRTR